MEEEITLDLRDFFDVLRKRLKLIVAITLTATIATALISLFVIDPTYESKVSVVVGKAAVSSKDKNYEYQDVMMYQQLVKTYAEIAKSDYVARKAITRLHLNMESKNLQAITKIAPQSDTQILNITVDSKNPQEAKEIVDALTEEFVIRAKDVIPNGNVQMLDKAQVPDKPIKPKKALNVAIAFFLGLMVSVGVCFLLEYMDSTVKSEEDIKKYLNIPVIGLIPYHDVE